MGRRANKIEQHLDPEQLASFNSRLSAMKGLTLAKIQQLADEYGVEVSLMSASTYRETTYEEYLAELKSKSQFAETLAEAAKSGQTMTDAASSILSSKLLSHIMESGELGNEEFNELSLALSRLRLGDQRAKKLEKDLAIKEARLQELEAEADERKQRAEELKESVNKAKSGGLTEETMLMIEEAIGLL